MNFLNDDKCDSCGEKLRQIKSTYLRRLKTFLKSICKTEFGGIENIMKNDSHIKHLNSKDNLSPEREEIVEVTEPFEFRQCVSIIRSTGRKAGNLRELREVIALISDECIFHHTYQYFLKEHVLEYTNDFAHWAGESLEERALSEQLSNIDPYGFMNIDDLRTKLLDVIDDYLKGFPEPRKTMPGNEFFFNETMTVIFPVGIRARNLAEFLTAIKYIDAGSIYYHFYEARIRLRGGVDDFSRWIEDVFGKKELVEKIRSIDPFMHTVEGIREHLSQAVEDEVKKDMEVINRCLTNM